MTAQPTAQPTSAPPPAAPISAGRKPARWTLAAVSALLGVLVVGQLNGQAGVPGLSNLTKAPAVSLPTLGKLPVQPALTGLDTSMVTDPAHVTDNASLADTRSKLSTLFGEHPVG